MKKIIALALALLLALSLIGCSINGTADGDENEDAFELSSALVYGDFEYAVNENGDFDIVGYTYSGAEPVSIEIPADIDGRPVTGIGDDAFKAVATISAVTLPASIEYIGNFAFYDCTALTSITIPNSVTTIGIGAFRGCTALTSITLSESLKSIGDHAFWDCKSLTSVKLPEALNTIGEGAFWNCVSLTEITIPASVKSIGRGAFIYCDSLTKATFASADLEIGEGAFIGCNEGLELVCTSDFTVKDENADKDEKYGLVEFAEEAELKLTYVPVAA